MEPRFDCVSYRDVTSEKAWPPVQSANSVGHNIMATNNRKEPIILSMNEHLCQVRSVSDPSYMDGLTSTHIGRVELFCDSPSPKSSVSKESKPYSSLISLDPDKCLTHHVRAKYIEIHLIYDDVFSPRIRRYNGASGLQ